MTLTVSYSGQEFDALKAALKPSLPPVARPILDSLEVTDGALRARVLGVGVEVVIHPSPLAPGSG